MINPVELSVLLNKKAFSLTAFLPNANIDRSHL